MRAGAAKLENYRLLDTTLYVKIEPCAMCAGALIWARVGRLVYGAKDLRAGAVDSIFQICAHPALNHRVDVVSGVLEDECRAVMQDFFRRKRSRPLEG